MADDAAADDAPLVLFVINVDFALVHFLLPLMRAARAQGWRVAAVCAEGPMLAPLRAEGWRVIAAPLVRRLDPIALARAVWVLARLMRAERPALVHGHMPIAGFAARLAARIARVPRVAYTCHGFLFNQPGPWPRRALSFAMEWLGGRLTDVFLTVSTEEAGDARRLGIHRHATAVLNGRDPAVFRPDEAARARIRVELGIAPGRVVVLAASRLVRHKGYPELLAAMATVDAELWVAGTRLATDRGPDMEAAIAASGLGTRARRLGYRADMAAVLAACDVFVLPSHFEGLPMSVIEAMLTGVAVVATAIRGPREQVQDGVSGLLVPPGRVAPLAEALARLVADPALRARMGQAGRAYACAHFDEGRVLLRTLDLLGIAPYPPPIRRSSP